MASLADIVIDYRDPATLAPFWAAVLDDYQVAPYDDEEFTRLSALGVTDVKDDPTVFVEAPTGPRLWFQKVPEKKTSKNRVHIDIRATDRQSEMDRLIVLGAEVVDEPTDQNLAVMRDPEGNEFCIIE